MTLAPSVRGQGLGAPLRTNCLEHVARAFPEVSSVQLLVNARWAAARRIYAAAGFVEIARLDHFFSTQGAEPQDGIVMRRKMRL